MMDPVLNIVIKSSVTRSQKMKQTRYKQEMSNIFCCLFLPSLMSLFFFLLIDVVKPVNNVEKGKDSWEDHP